MAIRQFPSDWEERAKYVIEKGGPLIDTRDIFRRSSENFSDSIAFVEKINNEAVNHCFKDCYNDLLAVGDGFLDYGFEGKKIVLSCGNSYHYVLLYSALSDGVGTVIPIEKEIPEAMYAKFLNLCDAQVVICKAENVSKVENCKKITPTLETIITSDERVDGCLFLEDIIEKGRSLADRGIFKNKQVDTSATSLMIFTSGTTGANKCVMLSQKNIMSNITNNIKCIRLAGPIMSVLPMTHAMEINCPVLSSVTTGRKVFICSSIKEFIPCMQFFKPYMFTGVPMMLEMILRNIWEGAKKAGKYDELKQAVAMSNKLIEQGIDRREEFFGHLVAPLGGNLKAIVAGGAPVSREIIYGLFEIGIDVIVGYGISECGPLVSMNADTYHYPNSVGPIVPDSVGRLADIDSEGVGELEIKGSSVMNGYYKDEAATRTVMTDDGFFKTGDYGRFTDNGMLELVGRKKNLIILANGKNVYPEELETEIKNNIPYINDIMVYSAKCNVRGESIERICCALNIIPDCKIDEKQIIDDFRKANSLMPVYKRVNYVLLFNEEFDKTPLRKIIREKVLAKHDPDNGFTI